MAYVTRSMELPDHTMDDPQPLNKKAPYKRRMTDKRRDQNRAAQKTSEAQRASELLERQVAALQDLNPTSNQDACMPRASSGIVASDMALSVLSKESSSSSASTLSSSQDPALVQLRNLLDIDDQEDTDGLLEFALKEKPDVSRILLAGLQALKSARQRVSSCHESNQVEVLQPQTLPDSRPKTPLVFLNDLPLFPDLLAGGIFLRHQPMMDVFHHNCQKIGLQLDEMVRSTCQSPWYSPFSSVPSSLVPLDTVPPDLYPTPAQQRFPHHPFIDIIPFPWLRERAITLDSLDPPPYNRFELKSDILSNGMICWKSRAGSEGLPWDRRSWEVQPWFWNKWSWLIEEQGKVEQQSRWWRALRE